ncbi:MAG TPA: ParB/RepB/Spo0J family partition protein [Candidatus Bathyarchaeia archaeon]|nr:ParB/RepB/Spo0J family partition protein [Candidatus Bathyarchaeia archaeon]
MAVHLGSGRTGITGNRQSSRPRFPQPNTTYTFADWAYNVQDCAPSNDWRQSSSIQPLLRTPGHELFRNHMTTEKRRVLGRGLETLLPSRPVPHGPTPVPAPAKPDGDEVLQIPLDQLDHNPYQTRTTSLDPVALEELAASIKSVGVLQPIVVRPAAGDRYQVIAGERRWQASRIAGLTAIPALLRQVSNEQAMEMTIIENLQREDLNPIEQARAYDRLSRDFGLTQEQMSIRTGADRSSIANFLRLLKLPVLVQGMLEKDQISFGHAKSLMPLPSPAELERVATRIVEDGLSVRQTEEMVTALTHPHPKAVKERVVDPNVREAETKLQEALGVRVTIEDRNGRGKILIQYKTLEDFDRILEALKVH